MNKRTKIIIGIIIGTIVGFFVGLAVDAYTPLYIIFDPIWVAFPYTFFRLTVWLFIIMFAAIGWLIGEELK
jgi:ABC-type nitrate/sulfonate/bicarbonate transport system permease component